MKNRQTFDETPPRAGGGLATDGRAASLTAEWLQGGDADVTLDERVGRSFELLREPVYRYLVATFGRPADAEDITQEAFLQLYRVLRGGGDVENSRAWVFRVAHNLAINRMTHERFLQPLEAAAWDDLCARREDAGPDPEQRAIENERWAEFRDDVGRLSPQQRQCLLLRVEGFRYREIAEILGVSISTVKEFLRRGIGKLTRRPDADA